MTRYQQHFVIFKTLLPFIFCIYAKIEQKRKKKGPASVLTITITVVTEAIKSYKWSAKSVIKFNILFLFRIVELRELCAERRLTGGTSISEDSWRGLVAGIMIFFSVQQHGTGAAGKLNWSLLVLTVATDWLKLAPRGRRRWLESPTVENVKNSK